MKQKKKKNYVLEPTTKKYVTLSPEVDFALKLSILYWLVDVLEKSRYYWFV